MQNPHTGTVGRGALLLALLLTLAHSVSPSGAGEVYKSVDADGHVIYSDRASSSKAQKSTVTVQEPDPANVAQLAKQQTLLQAQDTERSRLQESAARKKAEEDQARHQQCEQARNRYFAMRDARRVYQRDAQGNRVYYSDADADAKREEARKTMVAACGE